MSVFFSFPLEDFYTNLEGMMSRKIHATIINAPELLMSFVAVVLYLSGEEKVMRQDM